MIKVEYSLLKEIVKQYNKLGGKVPESRFIKRLLISSFIMDLYNKKVKENEKQS